ncbi:MAG: hypothetical protein ABI321_19120 [Polyangia bacterium]
MAKTFTSYDDFVAFAGVLDDVERFAGLGIEPDEDRGAFATERLAELQAYCGTHPSYHVVTEVDESPSGNFMLANCVRIANRVSYFLADGAIDDAVLDEEVR